MGHFSEALASTFSGWIARKNVEKAWAIVMVGQVHFIAARPRGN